MARFEIFSRLWPFSASDVVHDSRLRGAALPVLLLLDKWTRDGTCSLRVGSLCGHLRENRRTVEMALNVIERAGYFRRTGHDN
jgi:hypothetical protein